MSSVAQSLLSFWQWILGATSVGGMGFVGLLPEGWGADIRGFFEHYAPKATLVWDATIYHMTGVIPGQQYGERSNPYLREEEEQPDKISSIPPVWNSPFWIESLPPNPVDPDYDDYNFGMPPDRIFDMGWGLPAILARFLGGRGDVNNVDPIVPSSGNLPNSFCPPSICDPPYSLNPASPMDQNAKFNFDRLFFYGAVAAILDNIEIEMIEVIT
jgi:hypothetical protein